MEKRVKQSVAPESRNRSTHNQFEMALSAALGLAGAANYCPVLVGAIGGAR